jgi:CubicO group peptidase (beta-lactamase class C family)
MSADLFQQLSDLIQREMARLHVPGVALAVLDGDEETIQGFGVTSVENPLPIDADTLFQIGSTTKTVTATLAMQMVEAGQLDLDAPVRSYLPGFHMADEGAAARVTMRHLLTHTSGWAGDYFDDTGSGDDALAVMVERMARLPQVTPLGRFWSYNNAGFYLAGRVLEAIGSQPYDVLALERVLRPLGMDRSFLTAADCITYRVAVGHEPVYGDSTETPKVARPWALSRAIGPAGGIISTARDQLRYARFALGDGATAGGGRLLSPTSMALMQTPQVQAANGEGMGLAWFIKELAPVEPGGSPVRLVRHGGGTKGQITAFQLAPDQRFAIAILTNSARGGELNEIALSWVFRHYLGVEAPKPSPIQASPEQLAEYAGTYPALGEEIIVRVEGDRFVVDLLDKGGFPTPDTPPGPSIPPVRAALCERDRILLLEPPAEGTTGEFLREPDGRVAWLRIGGRMHWRA